MLTGEQVAAHSTQDDLWMIIHGKAYDLTDVSLLSKLYPLWLGSLPRARITLTRAPPRAPPSRFSSRLLTRAGSKSCLSLRARMRPRNT